jgi:fatty acid desaturase
LLFWIVPLYSVFPALLRLMDLTEHVWSEPSQNILANTRSSAPTVLTRIFLADVPRTLHREHHILAGVPVVHLFRLHRVLARSGIVPAATTFGAVLAEIPWTARPRDAAWSTPETARPRNAAWSTPETNDGHHRK